MVYENERGCVKMLTQPHQVTGVARNSLAGENPESSSPSAEE